MKIRIIAVILLLLLIPVSSADNSITNFVNVEDFQGYSPAQEDYIEALYSFDAKYSTTVYIDFKLQQDEILEDEWFITFILDGDERNDEEMSPGVFISDEIAITSGTHTLKVIAEARPNVIPSTYEYTITLFSEDVEIKSKKSTSSGGSGNWPILTPTPTPTPVPAVIVPQELALETNETNITVVYSLHNLMEASQEQDNTGLYVGGIFGILLLLLTLYLYKKYRNRDTPK